MHPRLSQKVRKTRWKNFLFSSLRRFRPFDFTKWVTVALLIYSHSFQIVSPVFSIKRHLSCLSVAVGRRIEQHWVTEWIMNQIFGEIERKSSSNRSSSLTTTMGKAESSASRAARLHSRTSTNPQSVCTESLQSSRVCFKLLMCGINLRTSRSHRSRQLLSPVYLHEISPTSLISASQPDWLPERLSHLWKFPPWPVPEWEWMSDLFLAPPE